MKTGKKIVRNTAAVLLVWVLLMAVSGLYPSARFAVWAAARREHIADYRVVQTVECEDGARLLLLESPECLACMRLEREGLFYRARVPGAVLQEDSAPFLAGSAWGWMDHGHITWYMYGKVQSDEITRLEAVPYGWEWLGEGKTVWESTARGGCFLCAQTVLLPDENMWSEIAFLPYAEDGAALQKMLDERGQYAITLEEGGEKG